MFCHHCGNRLPNDASFCNQCGGRVAPLERPPSSKVTRQISTGFNPEPSQAVPQTQQTMSAEYPSQTFLPSWNISGFQHPPTLSSEQSVQPTTPPIWQAPTSFQSQWPMQQALSPQAPPPSTVQRFLVRIFQPALASNALFGIILGGVLAAIGGALVTALFLAIAHALSPQSGPGTNGVSGQTLIDYALGIVPLHSPFRDSLQLFLVAHGVGLHLQYQYGSSSGVSIYSYNAALDGLLIIPALFLTFAGYLAASTDFQNNRQSSLLRGAAIAIPYLILLFIMSFQVNGCIPEVGSDGSVSVCTGTSTSLLSIDNFSLFLLGVLSSVLFGLLGASLKLGRGQWRHMMLQYLRTTIRPQLTGMFVGALAAIGLGFSLSLLFIFGLLAYTTYSTPLLSQSICVAGNWQTLFASGISQGPLYALNLFFFSFGTPLTISNPQRSPCFYIRDAHATFGLFGGTLHPPSWLFVLLAIPVISLFLGGRVSAAIGRVQGAGPGAVQGAIIALPFTVLVILLSVISTITYTYTTQSNASSGSPTVNTVVQTAGAGIFDLLLWALLSGVVLGAIGGIYQTSSMKTSVSKLLQALLLPVRVLGKPGYFVVDRLSGSTDSSQRSSARRLLYSAFLCALLLAIAAGIVGGLLLSLYQTLTFDVDLRIMNIVSVILIALPGLLLLGASSSALVNDPVQNQNGIPTMRM